MVWFWKHFWTLFRISPCILLCEALYVGITSLVLKELCDVVSKNSSGKLIYEPLEGNWAETISKTRS